MKDPIDDLHGIERLQHRLARRVLKPTSINVAIQLQHQRLDNGGWGRNISAARSEPPRLSDEHEDLLRQGLANPDVHHGFERSFRELFTPKVNHREGLYRKTGADVPDPHTGGDRSHQSFEEHLQDVKQHKDRTNPRVVTAAALLGVNAVSGALDYATQSRELPKRKQFDADMDGEGPAGVYDTTEVGRFKLVQRQRTRNLSRFGKLKARVAPYHAVVHELSDSYGGREEGGWYYTSGKLEHTSRGHLTQRSANRTAETLRETYTHKDRNSLNISASDAYQEDLDKGVFEPMMYQDNAAHAEGMPSHFIQEPLDEDYDYSHFGQHSKDYQVSTVKGTSGDYPQSRPYYE